MAFNKTRALQEAERSLAQGRISEAVQQYLNIVEKDPSDLAVINLAGDLCARAKNIPEALRLFRRLAESYIYEGFVPRAVAIYKKILKLEPSSVDARLRLASLYSGQGLPREARDLYAQALAICQDEKLQDKALEVMRQIAVDEPGNIAHRLRLAELYKAAGQLEEEFQTYLEAAEIALRESNVDIATRAMERAAALRPDDRRLRVLRQRLFPDSTSIEETPVSEPEPASASHPIPPPENIEEIVREPEDFEAPAIPQQEESLSGLGASEIDLSDEFDLMTAGQAAPGTEGIDIDDLELEIDFYLNYGMAPKAFEKLDQLQREYPGDFRLVELRQRCEQSADRERRADERTGPAAASESPRANSVRQLDAGWPTAMDPDRQDKAAPSASGLPGAGTDFSASLGALLNELGTEATAPPSENDRQTHYELGIAFREMGLVDEAVGELQKALRGSRPATDRERFLSACSLLALCFVEKQMPVLAAKWYTRALQVPGLDPDAVLALQYDLGVAYELAGNLEAARQNFLEVYGQNIEYRDVAAKIRRLAASR